MFRMSIRRPTLREPCRLDDESGTEDERRAPVFSISGPPPRYPELSEGTSLTYWAHSDPDGRPPEHPAAKWQRLSEHLDNVAAIAAELAHGARPGEAPFRTAAELAGRLHDFGKYTDCFQKMIRSGEGRCPHSGHGAVIAHDTGYLDVAFAIAGHHAGIPDKTGGTGTLSVRVKESRKKPNRCARGLRKIARPYRLSFTRRVLAGPT